MIRWMLTAVALAACGLASAKLPPPDEAAKAKAAEAAAKSAWQGKLDAFQLCKAQDRVASMYKKTSTAKVAGTPAGGASAPAGATPSLTAAAMPQPTTTSASQGGSTPNPAAAPAVAPPPACADPGPFAYAPPEQKPLEASGAHSPAANASSPPSVRAESGTMTSGKQGGTAPGPGGAPGAPARK